MDSRYDPRRDYRSYVVDEARDGPLLTTTESARRLLVSSNAVIAMVNNGRLPSARGPQRERPRYLIPAWAVDALAEMRQGRAGPPDREDDLRRLSPMVEMVVRGVLAGVASPAARSESQEAGPDARTLAAQLAAALREGERRKEAGILREEAAALMRQAEEKFARAARLDLEAEEAHREVVLLDLAPETPAGLQ